jgi:hypothetical protein
MRASLKMAAVLMSGTYSVCHENEGTSSSPSDVDSYFIITELTRFCFQHTVTC